MPRSAYWTAVLAAMAFPLGCGLALRASDPSMVLTGLALLLAPIPAAYCLVCRRL